MRWPVKPDDWKRRFAFLPILTGDEWLWLEWFEARPMGEFTEVRHVGE